MFRDSSIFAIIRKLDGKFGDKSPFASVASLHALFKVIKVNEHDDDDRNSGCGGLASGSPMLRFGALHGLFVASTRAPNPQTISGQIAANMFAKAESPKTETQALRFHPRSNARLARESGRNLGKNPPTLGVCGLP